MVDKIRLGMIGASSNGGWASRAHLPAAATSPDVELVAVCTNHQESAEESARKFGAKLAFHDYREMLDHADIDAVDIVVRVPSHFALTRDVIDAGKAVYTEWPLGRTTAEAVELADFATQRGVPNATGLQARVSPGLMYMRDLVAEGFLGEVVCARASLIRPNGMLRHSSHFWQRDADQGANTLTIGAGHTLDALAFVVGDFGELASVVSTQTKELLEPETNRVLDVTAPDNVLVNGHLKNGGIASLHVSDTPWGSAGFSLEVYGRDGALVASGSKAPQYSEVNLRGARRSNSFEELTIPDQYSWVGESVPQGDPFNVAQMYHRFASSIREGSTTHPDFNAAVKLHQLLDLVQESSVRDQRQTDDH